MISRLGVRIPLSALDVNDDLRGTIHAASSRQDPQAEFVMGLRFGQSVSSRLQEPQKNPQPLAKTIRSMSVRQPIRNGRGNPFPTTFGRQDRFDFRLGLIAGQARNHEIGW